MKRLLGWLVGLAAAMTLTVHGVTLEWDGVQDTNVVGYRLYYKPATNATWLSTNTVGRLSTNVVISATPNVLYQAYVTSVSDIGLESDPSNQVRYQNFFVNGIGKATALTLGDVGTTNFAAFLLVQQPTNGIVSGVAPNVLFTPTSNFGNKDMFVYQSPEMWMGQHITNYYGVLKNLTNKPPVLLEDNP